MLFPQELKGERSRYEYYYEQADRAGKPQNDLSAGSTPPKAGAKIRVNAVVVCDGSGVTAYGRIVEMARNEISN